MSDDKSQNDLVDRIKKMPEDELKSYYGIAKTVNRIINIIGISLFLCVMFFTSWIVTITCAFIIAFVAKSGSEVMNLKRLIEQEMLKFQKR